MALNTRIGPTAVAAGLGLAALANAGSAHAVTCKSIADDVLLTSPDTHFIYGSGGSAITPTLSKVAYVLSKASQPIFVFYQDASGAVPGYQSYVNSTGGTTSRPFRYWRTEADVSANDKTCTADDPGVGREVDFATTGGTLKLFDLDLVAGSGVFTGPTQGINLVVPYASTETAISAEALFYVYGFGDASQFSGVAPGNQIPWTNKSYIFRRSATAFVQQFLVGAIRSLGGNASGIAADLPAATASSPDNNQGSVDNVIAAAGNGHAQDAIGFTSGPTADADKNRGPGKVHTLAYQHAGQDAAYWPDSSSDSHDKINIRNGHYFLWDTNQFFVRISGSSAHPTLDQITNEDVRKFIGYFTGQLPFPDNAVTRAIIETGSIPQCAMQVTRANDFDGLSCYAPPTPCGHYFESIATGAPTGDACSTDADCGHAEPKCRFNFCEAY